MSSVPTFRNISSASAHEFDFYEPKLYKRMRSEVWPLAKAIPVYLVSPPDMDKICPPQIKWVLDEEGVRKETGIQPPGRVATASPDPKKSDSDSRAQSASLRILDLINFKSCTKRFEAIGLYVSNTTEAGICGIFPRKVACNASAIFLCPERIKQIAINNKVPLDLALAEVYYHELGHAELDVGRIPWEEGHWVRVIEESLCHGLALSHFLDPEEIRLVQRLLDDSSLEYRGYRYIWQISADIASAVWAFPSADTIMQGMSVRGLRIGRIVHLIPGLRLIPTTFPSLLQVRTAGNRAWQILERILHHTSQEPIVPENQWAEEGTSESNAQRAFQSTVEDFSAFAALEPPIPYPYRGVKAKWCAYKRGDFDAEPREFWEDLAEELVRTVLRFG